MEVELRLGVEGANQSFSPIGVSLSMATPVGPPLLTSARLAGARNCGANDIAWRASPSTCEAVHEVRSLSLMDSDGLPRRSI